MRSALLYILWLMLYGTAYSQGPGLKSVLYDFDGLDIGQTSLPDGDYSNYDLSYEVVSPPGGTYSALGDRVLQLDLAWSAGKGEFGKGITHFIELDAASDHVSFYLLNPLSNFRAAEIEVVIKEDVNQDASYVSADDDRWSATVTVPRSASWQLVNVPLTLFSDGNAGGNGTFDAGHDPAWGRVLITALIFHTPSLPAAPETYFLDMFSFTAGGLPSGPGIASAPLPAPGDHCLLGSLAYKSPATDVPPEMQALLGSSNQLHYINIFMPLAYAGTTPNVYPGGTVQALIDNGYSPMITWEFMFTSLSPTDPAQPQLSDITGGALDGYIDNFADAVAAINGTVLIRPFHEFDGNWYPWSIELNGQNPLLLRDAFRYLHDRFEAKGVSNVEWVFSPNSRPVPDESYNWLVAAYPGDEYVDAVSTNIYNHATPGVPAWKSFRYQAAEIYHYLTTYYPSKPLIIGELGVRERYPGEDASSQTKGEWYCSMAQDLQSYFSKVRGLIIFQEDKIHDWRINSTAASLAGFQSCVWNDGYFTDPVSTGTGQLQLPAGFSLYPNPVSSMVRLVAPEDEYRVEVTDMMGRILSVQQFSGTATEFDFTLLPPGIYTLTLRGGRHHSVLRFIRK